MTKRKEIWYEMSGLQVFKKIIYSLLFALLLVSVAMVGGWQSASGVGASLLVILMLAILFYFAIKQYRDVLIGYALIIITYVMITGIMYFAGITQDGGSLGLFTNTVAVVGAIILSKNGFDKADIFTFFVIVITLVILSMAGAIGNIDAYIGGLI